MSIWSIRFAALLLGVATLGLWNCGPVDRIAGGSEIGNPVGMVVDGNGRGRPGVALRLLPFDFNPLLSGADPDSLQATTDDTGAYRFEKISSGRYTLLAYEPATGLRFRSEMEWSTTQARKGRDTLRAPGKVIVQFPDTTIQSGYCYLPGTPFFARIDALGRAVFDSLPGGPTDLVFLPDFPGADSQAAPVFAPLAVLPGSEVKAMPVGAVSGKFKAYQASPGDDLQVLADSLAPGDTLYLRGGVHALANLTLAGQGRPEAWIIIRNFPGERPILRGTSPDYNLIDLVGAQYVHVQGLEIDSTMDGSDAIKLGDQAVSHHIVLRDLHIHHIRGIGINGQGDHHQIAVEHCQIDHLYGDATTAIRIGDIGGRSAPSLWSVTGNWIHHIGFDGSGGSGINVFLSAGSIRIADNQVHDNAILGIRVFGLAGAAMEADLAMVESNAVWNCGEGLSLYSDATARNNVVFGCALPIVSFAYADANVNGNLPRNLRVYNNTFYGGDSLDLENWDSTRTCIFANNAVYASSFGLRLDGSGNVYGNVGDRVATGISLGAAAADLGDGPNQNFNLVGGGALVGKSIPPLVATFDYYGRIRDDQPDVGAIEYSSGMAAKITAGFK